MSELKDHPPQVLNTQAKHDKKDDPAAIKLYKVQGLILFGAQFLQL